MRRINHPGTRLALDSLGRSESRAAQAARSDYLKLGPGRSLEALLSRYQAAGRAPTLRMRTLRAWASRFNWQECAESHDQLEQSRIESLERERCRLAMQSGLALTGQRVENLKDLFARTLTYLEAAMPVWMDDLQTQARTHRFNTGVLIQLRGILDDLARETGGRVSRLVTTTPPAAALADDDLLASLRQLSQEDQESLDKLFQKIMTSAEGVDLTQPEMPGFKR